MTENRSINHTPKKDNNVINFQDTRQVNNNNYKTKYIFLPNRNMRMNILMPFKMGVKKVR